MADATVLTVKNMKMSFAGNIVLDDINFSLEKGEILALLGENGAGKSTLMKILNGIYKQKEGIFSLSDDRPCNFNNTKDAQDNGIVLVHQELNLAPNRTVAENIVLGNEPVQKGLGHLFSFVDKSKMRELASEYLDMIHAEDIDIDAPLYKLTAAQQQLVEIAKALKVKPRILLLDEPTSSLSDEQAQYLINVLHKLKKEIGIIFTTHRIQEALDVTNNFLILRDGKQIAHIFDAKEKIIYEKVIEMMVGRTIENIYPKIDVPIGEKILSINALSDRSHAIHDIEVHAGEIFGFGGLVGAGRSEVMRLLFGADKSNKYDVVFNGKRIKINHPFNAVRLGIGYVPEERKLLSIIPDRNIVENMVLPKLISSRKSLFVKRKELDPEVEAFVDSLDIKLSSIQQKIKFLSGGNQQKVVLAKWLMINPKVLVLDEPTRGIDVGAKAEIYKLMGDLAGKGMAIILISSDLSELVSLSDKVAVMSEGKIIKVLGKTDLTSEKVMYYAGMHRQKETEANPIEE